MAISETGIILDGHIFSDPCSTCLYFNVKTHSKSDFKQRVCKAFPDDELSKRILNKIPAQRGLSM